MSRKHAQSQYSAALFAEALATAFRKLDPSVLIRNPVIFVTSVVALLTTVLSFTGPLLGAAAGESFLVLQITVWLWLTVLFANFAEAVAEGRGKAQAAALRATKTETEAKRLPGADAARSAYERVSSSKLRRGDVVLVEAGDIVPPTARSSRVSPRSTRAPSPAKARR